MICIASLFCRLLLTCFVLLGLAQQVYADHHTARVTLYTVLNSYGYTENECNALRDLLSLYDVDLDEAFPEDSAEQELVKKTQEACLRQGERFHTSEYNNNLSARLLEQRTKLEAAAVQAGLAEKISPKAEVLNLPHIALIPGALDQRICCRFQALVDQILSQKIAPALVVAVTGYRDLEKYEAVDVDLDERTEASLMAYRWQQYVQKYQELQDIPFIVSQAPLKMGQKRSNTFDTVEHVRLCCHEIFEKTPHAVLYIEQPFARRFLGIFKTLPVDISVSARRLEPLPDDKLYTYGDEVARTIYFYAQEK